MGPLGETECCGRGQGVSWGSNHRPGHSGPLFQSDWSQMHSDISRDSWSSAPSGHQPKESLIQSQPHQQPFSQPHPIWLTNFNWGLLLHPGGSSCCESLQMTIYTIKPHLWLSHSIHTSTKSLISSLPGRQHLPGGACMCAGGGGSFTLLIFSFGCVRSAGKWLRASQLSTTWVCSSVPVTMFPTALRAAVWVWRGSVTFVKRIITVKPCLMFYRCDP